MKKERIVALCICALLLGGIQAQWVAWFCQQAIVSSTRSAWNTGADEQAGNAGEIQPAFLPSNVLRAVVCAGWPPLGFIYTETLLASRHRGQRPVSPAGSHREVARLHRQQKP